MRRAEAEKTCPESDYVLPPYLVKEIEGVKIGLLGFTTDRGPQVVGSAVTGNRGQPTKSGEAEPCRCIVLDTCGCLTVFGSPGTVASG